MAGELSTQRIQQSVKSLRTDWVEIGGLGRLAIIGVVLAFVVTVALGFSITRAARGHLLDARAAMVTVAVEDLPPFPTERESSRAEYAAFDVAVRVSLLGGETVRVKVFVPDGTIVYSDATELVGQQFELSVHAVGAFTGETGTHISDLSDPAHAFDRGHGELIEFYVPMRDATGEVATVIEVEQDASGLNDALELIARNVWASIAIGLTAIGLVMAVGIAARTREVNRRRRQAEELLESSFSAQEAERRRIVGALHDDIGQPMYRLLYGIEGSRAKLDPSDPIAVELDHLADVVRDMDGTLRNELRLLHFELAADAGLATALAELADLTRLETDLEVDLSIDLDHEPGPVYRTEFYRAAREAITNVRKHADATRVIVRFTGGIDRLTLEVIDDGISFQRATYFGLGLSTTRRRFRSLDGDVMLEGRGSGGTRFLAWLPRREEVPE
ncbi:MAG: ATP-binding protein [Acidimicrobiia bacterium]